MTGARYALHDVDAGVRLAQWQAMEGFFVGDWTDEDLFVDPDSVPSPRLEIALEGLELLVDIACYLDKEDNVYAVDEARVDMLDIRGNVLGGYGLAWAALDLGSSGSGTLWGDTQLAPHRGARTVWDQWQVELPQQKDLWSRLPPDERKGWVEAARLHCSHDARRQGRRKWPMPEGDIVLEGRHATDVTSLFCAIGEAFSGPGGYFGGNLMGTDDCLMNLDRPKGQRITIAWKDSAVAQRALGTRLDHSFGEGYFDMALDVFARHNVDVILA